MDRFRFNPDTYLDLVTSEVPDYVKLQTEVVAAAGTGPIDSILDLGIGTGESSRRLLERHPGASTTGLDESPEMLARARQTLPSADLRVGRLEDSLPEGPFDLVVSVLAVHHLDGEAKADLFGRVARRIRPGGRFVLGDLVVPEDAGEADTPVDGEFDRPSRTGEQIAWLGAAGLDAFAAWTHRDLAVLVGVR